MAALEVSPATCGTCPCGFPFGIQFDQLNCLEGRCRPNVPAARLLIKALLVVELERREGTADLRIVCILFTYESTRCT